MPTLSYVVQSAGIGPVTRRRRIYHNQSSPDGLALLPTLVLNLFECEDCVNVTESGRYGDNDERPR